MTLVMFYERWKKTYSDFPLEKGSYNKNGGTVIVNIPEDVYKERRATEGKLL